MVAATAPTVMQTDADRASLARFLLESGGALGCAGERPDHRSRIGAWSTPRPACRGCSTRPSGRTWPRQLLRHVLEEAVAAGPTGRRHLAGPGAPRAGARLPVRPARCSTAWASTRAWRRLATRPIADGVDVAGRAPRRPPGAHRAGRDRPARRGARGRASSSRSPPMRRAPAPMAWPCRRRTSSRFHFGAGSLAAHRRAAKRRGGVDHSRPRGRVWRSTSTPPTTWPPGSRRSARRDPAATARRHPRGRGGRRPGGAHRGGGWPPPVSV